MGIPIDLGLLEPFHYGKAISIREERRDSTYMAPNSLVSSRGTMNGMLTLEKVESYMVPTYEMNYRNKSGYLAIWDDIGSYIAVISPQGEIHCQRIQHGIVNGHAGAMQNMNRLVHFCPVDPKQLIFLGEEDAVNYEIHTSGVQYDGLNVGKMKDSWLMSGQTYCCLFDDRLEVRNSITNNYMTLETFRIEDISFVECCPERNMIAMAKSNECIYIYELPRRGSQIVDKQTVWIMGFEDENIQRMLWSADGKFLCIVITNRVLVYDLENKSISVVSGEAQKFVQWGKDNKMFLLSTHLYGTILKVLEYNEDEQQWICCGFEDIRSQFHITRVKAINPCYHSNKIAIYHDTTLDVFDLSIT